MCLSWFSTFYNCQNNLKDIFLVQLNLEKNTVCRTKQAKEWCELCSCMPTTLPAAAWSMERALHWDSDDVAWVLKMLIITCFLPSVSSLGKWCFTEALNKKGHWFLFLTSQSSTLMTHLVLIFLFVVKQIYGLYSEKNQKNQDILYNSYQPWNLSSLKTSLMIRIDYLIEDFCSLELLKDESWLGRHCLKCCW